MTGWWVPGHPLGGDTRWETLTRSLGAAAAAQVPWGCRGGAGWETQGELCREGERVCQAGGGAAQGGGRPAASQRRLVRGCPPSASGRRRLARSLQLSPRLRRRLRADPAPCPHVGVRCSQRYPPGVATSLSDPLLQDPSSSSACPRVTVLSRSTVLPSPVLLSSRAISQFARLWPPSAPQGHPTAPTSRSLSIAGSVNTPPGTAL